MKTPPVEKLRANLYVLERARDAAHRLIAVRRLYASTYECSEEYGEVRTELAGAEFSWRNSVGPEDFVNLMALLDAAIAGQAGDDARDALPVKVETLAYLLGMGEPFSKPVGEGPFWWRSNLVDGIAGGWEALRAAIAGSTARD